MKLNMVSDPRGLGFKPFFFFFEPGITPFHYFDITEIQSPGLKETGKGKAGSRHHWETHCKHSSSSSSPWGENPVPSKTTYPNQSKIRNPEVTSTFRGEWLTSEHQAKPMQGRKHQMEQVSGQ